MKKHDIIIVEKRTSPIKSAFKFVTAVTFVACAATVAYKFVKNTIDSGILGKLDLDGDGDAETLVLDTTGDGEIDTIIINTDHSEEEE